MRARRCLSFNGGCMVRAPPQKTPVWCETGRGGRLAAGVRGGSGGGAHARPAPGGGCCGDGRRQSSGGGTRAMTEHQSRSSFLIKDLLSDVIDRPPRPPPHLSLDPGEFLLSAYIVFSLLVARVIFSNINFQ
jgi:hypothetical protein